MGLAEGNFRSISAIKRTQPIPVVLICGKADLH
jgi:hypothetical protein